MVEIKLQLDKQELTNTLNALNNAIISLDHVYAAMRFGCEYPKEFDPLCINKSFEEIDNTCDTRLKAILSLYNALLKYED